MAGLMGLGFGFSILSALEILYFATIRWIFHRHDAPPNTSLACAGDPTPAVTMDDNAQNEETKAYEWKDNLKFSDNNFKEQNNFFYSIHN